MTYSSWSDVDVSFELEFHPTLLLQNFEMCPRSNPTSDIKCYGTGVWGYHEGSPRTFVLTSGPEAALHGQRCGPKGCCATMATS